MRTIFKKIKIHPFFYLVMGISLFSGHFKSLIVFMSIIIFHELGHILIGLLFNWKIEKIIIMPFGGITLFNENINKPLLEEFFVCLGGPFFQCIYYIFISNFFNISHMHYSLLIFNLLPIVPLDGSKLFNMFFNRLFAFKLSYIYTNMLSILLILFGLLILIKQWNLLLFLTLLLLMVKTIKEIKETKYIFNKFLLERYVQDFKFKKIKVIKGVNLNKMYRDYKHIFYYNNNYCTEREIIRKRFDLQGKVW